MEADFTFKTLEALAILNKKESRAFINVNLKGRSQVYLQSHIQLHGLFHTDTQLALPHLLITKPPEFFCYTCLCRFFM
jgi:hypothetical protein